MTFINSTDGKLLTLEIVPTTLMFEFSRPSFIELIWVIPSIGDLLRTINIPNPMIDTTREILIRVFSSVSMS